MTGSFAVAYMRTSSEEQNPENQRKDLESICPPGTHFYVEMQSAYKDNLSARPHWNAIYNWVVAGKVSDVYCWDLDRLYRNRSLLRDFFSLCKARGVRIHSFRQQWLQQIHETPAPWGEIIHDMLVQIFGWMAEDESRRKSDRVRASVRVKDGRTLSYKGKVWGRKPLPKQTRDRILELHLQGESIRSIQAKVLTWKNGNGFPVSRGAVHKILCDFKGEKERIIDSPEKEQYVDGDLKNG